MLQADNACTTARALFASTADDDGPTMSSREIADLVESRHDKVKQSIERLVARGVIDLPPVGEEADVATTPTGGRRTYTVSVYRLCKRDSYIVVAQLSPEFTARLVDRWDELERQARETPPAFDLMKALDDPAFLRQALASKNDEVEKLRAITQELAPKAIALDRLETATDGSMCITDAAKVLQVRPKELFQYLQAHNWIYSRVGAQGYMAYQARLVSGHLEHKVTTVDRADGSEKVTHQVRVTAKGLAALGKLLPPLLMAVSR